MHTFTLGSELIAYVCCSDVHNAEWWVLEEEQNILHYRSEIMQNLSVKCKKTLLP